MTATRSESFAPAVGDRGGRIRAAVIGAGSSGIGALKALCDAGIDVVCFELGSEVGGNWRYRNDNGISACYETLRIDTSKTRMQFADYPMPEDYPDFPRHDQIAAYFDDYVDHFDLRRHIRFRTRVVSCVPRSDGRWDVTIAAEPAGSDSAPQVETFDAVLVANGHHWKPKWPDPAPEGEFRGRQIHSHAFEEKSLFDGIDVVICGLGNSAVDIAVESSKVAASTTLAVRGGAYVFSKYMFGRPADSLWSVPFIPLPVQQFFSSLLLGLTRGSMTRYGLPEPDHKPLQAHPTVSEEILAKLQRGEVVAKRQISRFDGDMVVFADGSSSRADLVVWATGYDISFPFLDAEVFGVDENQVPGLYWRVFAPDLPGLYFIGLIQPLGAVMPISAAQGKLVAAHLTGEYALPSRAAMRREIARHRAWVGKRFVKSRRHTIEIDYDNYLTLLPFERRLGALRARVGRGVGTAATRRG